MALIHVVRASRLITSYSGDSRFGNPTLWLRTIRLGLSLLRLRHHASRSKATSAYAGAQNNAAEAQIWSHRGGQFWCVESSLCQSSETADALTHRQGVHGPCHERACSSPRGPQKGTHHRPRKASASTPRSSCLVAASRCVLRLTLLTVV